MHSELVKSPGWAQQLDKLRRVSDEFTSFSNRRRGGGVACSMSTATCPGAAFMGAQRTDTPVCAVGWKPESQQISNDMFRLHNSIARLIAGMNRDSWHQSVINDFFS